MESKTKKIIYKGKEKEIPAHNPIETKCEYYIIAKYRYCSFEKVSNSEYCIYHVKDYEKEFKICPHDPKHRILASKYNKHLKTCNTLAQKNKMINNHWYKNEINKPKNSNVSTDKELAILYNQKWDELSNEEFESILDKIIASYEKVKSIYNLYVQQNKLEEIINNRFNLKTNDNNIKYSISGLSINKETDLHKTKNFINSEKHGKQNIAITQLILNSNMINEKELDEKGCLVIEFGAGKGKLSYQIHKSTNDKAINILLEREGMRYKNEKKQINMVRFRIDIIHFNMNYIDSINEMPFEAETKPFLLSKGYNIIGVAKHICGCAFDLSLTCMMNYSHIERIKGLCMATCCHHISRIELLNHLNIYQETLGLSIKEIAFLFKATSWIFGQIKPNASEDKLITDKDIKNQHSQIFMKKNVDKKYIGLISKYIVDLTRAIYLISKGFTVFYLKYCENTFTTENNLILALNTNKFI